MPPQPYGPPGMHRMPYGPPTGRGPYAPPPGRPSRGGRGGGLGAFLTVVILIVAGVLIPVGLYGAFDSGTGSEAGGGTSYTPYPSGKNPGVAATGANPILADPGSALSKAQCNYSPWSTQVEQAREFFESAAECLAAAWKPVLAKANLPFTPPVLSVTADTDGLSSPCSGSAANFAAVYCGANQTIYMPLSQLQTDEIKDHWEEYLSVFAHEYGHHIQEQAGILGQAHEDEYNAGGVNSSRGQEVSRRIELQAQCFDGMFLSATTAGGSLNSAQVASARDDAYHRGDENSDMRDHGTPRHSGDWWSAGYDGDNTAQCNTYTASAAKVS